MSYVALRCAGAELRRSPGRNAAIIVLLVVAAWLPEAVDAPAVVGALAAFAVAFAAAVGSVALAEQRTALLSANGARRGSQALVAMAAMGPVAVLASLVTVATSAMAGGRLNLLEAIATTLVVPITVAPLAAWATRQSEQRARAEAGDGNAKVSRLTLVLIVVAGVVMFPLGIAMAGAWLATRSTSSPGVRVAVSLGGALVALAFAVFVVGGSEDWFSLSLALLVMIPLLATGVAIVGVQAVNAVVRLAGRSGPRTRIALEPLVVRRRVLAPLVALVAVVSTLAVTEGVVGASFGQREADRSRTLPTVVLPAGNRADQAIASVPPVDAVALGAKAAETLRATGAQALVIAQVGTLRPTLADPAAAVNSSTAESADETGTGSTPLPRAATPGAPATWTSLGAGLGAGLGADELDSSESPQWLGVVGSADLALLGWQQAASPLQHGKLVIVGTTMSANRSGLVDLRLGASTFRRSAVMIEGVTGGADLPGALISAEAAAALHQPVTAARVVVVPTPGSTGGPDAARLVALARTIQAQAHDMKVDTPPGLTGAQRSAFESYVALMSVQGEVGPVRSGAERVVLWQSGALNEVPIFSGTSHDARRAILALVGLPILITLAVVLLALGATRREDEILAVQGAPGRLRSRVAAVQAGVMTGSAALVAACLGIGIPAACFALYNRRSDLPAIPLVVPGVVWIVLVGVPAVTIGLAALVPVVRRPAGATSHSDPFDPAW